MSETGTAPNVVEGVEMYPFHAQTYPVMPDLFHLRCAEHGPIFGCGERGAMEALRIRHLTAAHATAATADLPDGAA